MSWYSERLNEMNLTCQIPMKPQSWKRAVPVHGRMVKSADQRAYQEAVGYALKAARPKGWPLDLTYRLSVVFCMGKGALRCDVDNLLKNIMDAGTGIVWHDDRAIMEVRGVKQPTVHDAIHLMVTTL